MGPVLSLLPHPLYHEVAALTTDQSFVPDVPSGVEIQGIADPCDDVPQVSARSAVSGEVYTYSVSISRSFLPISSSSLINNIGSVSVHFLHFRCKQL